MIDSAVTDLPEPELADQRHRLAAVDVERDAVDGQHLPLTEAEGDGEILDLQQGLS